MPKQRASAVYSTPLSVRISTMFREERAFLTIFFTIAVGELLLGLYLYLAPLPPSRYIPKPEVRPIAKLMVREEPPPPPPKVEEKPKPIKRLVKKEEYKKIYSPPVSSAIGSPKRLAPLKKEDPKKIVAKKGLLGVISKKGTEADLRGFNPIKDSTVSEHLQTVRADKLKTEDDTDDFLGIGNNPDVARKSEGIGYIVNAKKIGEIRETQLELYKDPSTELDVEIIWEEDTGGGRSASEISKIVQNYLGGLRYLYKKYLRQDPALKGKIQVRFLIEASGVVSETSLVDSSLGNFALEQAILKRIRTWKFPQIPKGEVTVTYPFVFLPPTT
ncbi:TonB family protein [Thermodesulfobacteriota bacterium]